MSRFQSNGVPLSVSQNFLTSRSTIGRLLRLTNITSADTVLEIGAGRGHITRALLNCGCRVWAVELDRMLYNRLAVLFSGRSNLRLIQGDFFRIPLPAGPYKVFANIPFSCTTDILRRLTNAANPPQETWLVLEKGAAKRFCGKPCDNFQSLLLKPYFDMEVVYYFSREDFHPAPRVDCVMLHLHKKSKPDIPMSERMAYRRFLKHSLCYGLFGSRALLTKKQVATALRSAGLAPVSPFGEVLYIQWLCLFRCWRQMAAHL